MADSSKPWRRRRRLFALTAAATGSWLYQRRGEASDLKRYPVPGTLLDVGGRRLHFQDHGGSGAPMMIETGAGTLAADWEPILERMRRVGHVFSYERAGIGWSDGGSWRNEATRAVDDLHRLLVSLEPEETWVLVGHSLGGLLARQFAGRYPDQVDGLVLIDPSHEEQLERGRSVFGRKAMAAQVALSVAYVAFPRSLARLALSLGAARLAKKLVGGDTDEETRRNVALYLRSGFRRSYLAEMSSMLVIARSMRADPPALRDMPVAVVTAAPPENESSFMGRFRNDWVEMHDSIAASSGCSIHLTATRGGHFVYKDDPDVVIEALEWVVRQCDLAATATHAAPVA